MPVEPGQAPARGAPPATPDDRAAPAEAVAPVAPAPRVVPAAPRPPHDEHELPDGRYLLAYRSATDA